MFSGISRHLGILALGLVCLAFATPARAGGTNVTVHAQLVWGTNLKESSSKDHKPVDSKTAEDLRKVFKWQNYFVIKSETVELTQGKQQELKMSDKCALEIKSVGNDKFEVLLLGKGERVAKGVQKMPPGEKVFLMGVSENESSWLVILKQKKDK
jgi:hypothetical protein